MENQIVPVKSLLLDVTMFEHAQRVGKMLTASTMVPEHFRNNIGNCIIALNYANRVDIDPFMIMQKMYIIHGKPAIEAKLQIALFNKSGLFSALKYNMSGQGDLRQCIATAKEKSTGDTLEGPPVSIKMAKDEGWYGKSGSKWKTLPELMLRYRAASFFIGLYAPETTLGLSTAEELQESDIIDVTPKDVKTEISQHANTGEIIDVGELPPNKSSNEPMSEQKAEILAREIAEAENTGVEDECPFG